MAISTCGNCGNDYYWRWEDAFDKFGFGDGDGQVETWQVRAALEGAGYTVEQHAWGLHNTVILSIKKDGLEQIPDGAAAGYDNPRVYLPDEIIALLDRAFPVADPCRDPEVAS